MLLSYSTRAEIGGLHYILCCCCRDHTLHTLHEVYEKRRALNLEAITLMVPQVTLTLTTSISTPASASPVDGAMHSVCSVAFPAE